MAENQEQALETLVAKRKSELQCSKDEPKKGKLEINDVSDPKSDPVALSPCSDSSNISPPNKNHPEESNTERLSKPVRFEDVDDDDDEEENSDDDEEEDDSEDEDEEFGSDSDSEGEEESEKIVKKSMSDSKRKGLVHGSSNGKAMVDKGKGIVKDKGKGKGKSKIEEDSDEDAIDEEDDSYFSDDPLAEIDPSNILPPTARRRVTHPGAFLINDLGGADDDNKEDDDSD